MNNKQLVALLATFFAQQVLALNVHRHAHGVLHQKKDVVTIQEVETVTDVTVVTVYADGSPVESSTSDSTTTTKAVYKAGSHQTRSTTSTSSTSTSSTSTTPTPTPTPATTFSTETKPTTTSTSSSSSVEIAHIAAAVETASTSSSAAATTTSSSATSTATSSSSSNKRGLAYNSGSLLSPFLNSGTKISWSYNWAQTVDSSAPSSLEYVAMMWGPIYKSTWSANAETAITNGVKYFLSFNEPDNSGQANLDAATAATDHQTLLNPYASRVKIGSPAITNSNIAGQGTEWLSAWVTACNGNCKYDFCAVHWYDVANTQKLLDHLTASYKICQKPLWLTEFAPTGTDDEINTFLTSIMNTLDNDSNYSFVERYAYFMAKTGSLLTSTTSLSTYGNTYAYA